jgi:hypothetical protein
LIGERERKVERIRESERDREISKELMKVRMMVNGEREK